MDGAIRFWVLGGISVSVIIQLQKLVLQSFHYGNGDREQKVIGLRTKVTLKVMLDVPILETS